MSNITPVDRLKKALNAESVQQQFKNALKENSNLFVASLIDVYSTDKYLQECDPCKVIVEALKAATLKLPINKSLGFAYIVPYKKEPTFIPGYKGYIQLAMRTGMYKCLNADKVYEGEFKGRDKLTGEVDLSGEATNDKIIGYFCHMEMLNGFRKTFYMTTDEVTKHAKKYSPSFGSSSSAWKTNFDAMALKTVVRYLLSHYGFLSVEMLNMVANDIGADERDYETRVAEEITENANTETIDIQAEVVEERPAESEGTKAEPAPETKPEPKDGHSEWDEMEPDLAPTCTDGPSF